MFPLLSIEKLSSVVVFAVYSVSVRTGYYARVAVFRELMKKFVNCAQGRCQVVNLGAGFDTTYWQSQEEGWAPQKYVEVDFSEVTSTKCFHIK